MNIIEKLEARLAAIYHQPYTLSTCMETSLAGFCGFLPDISREIDPAVQHKINELQTWADNHADCCTDDGTYLIDLSGATDLLRLVNEGRGDLVVGDEHGYHMLQEAPDIALKLIETAFIHGARTVIMYG